MRQAGKVFAVVCAVFFVITTVIALVLFNLERKVFDSSTYKQALEDQKLYTHMPEILAGGVMERVNQNPDAPAYMKNLKENEWQVMISSLLPPEELKSLSNEALDSVFAYINGKTDSAKVSLLPLKRNMAGEAGVQAMKQLLRAQPDCTFEQITNMSMSLLTTGKLELCNPPAELDSLIEPLLGSQVSFMTLAIPDEVILIQGNKSGTPDDPRTGLNKLRTWMRLSPLLPLGFLLLITLLAVRALKDLLTWWGYPFLVSGIFSAFTGWFGISFIAIRFSRILQSRASASMPPSFIEAGQNVAGAVARQLLAPVVLEGIILAGVGLIMVIVARVMAKQEKNQDH